MTGICLRFQSNEDLNGGDLDSDPCSESEDMGELDAERLDASHREILAKLKRQELEEREEIERELRQAQKDALVRARHHDELRAQELRAQDEHQDHQHRTSESPSSPAPLQTEIRNQRPPGLLAQHGLMTKSHSHLQMDKAHTLNDIKPHILAGDKPPHMMGLPGDNPHMLMGDNPHNMLMGDKSHMLMGDKLHMLQGDKPHMLGDKAIFLGDKSHLLLGGGEKPHLLDDKGHLQVDKGHLKDNERDDQSDKMSTDKPRDLTSSPHHLSPQQQQPPPRLSASSGGTFDSKESNPPPIDFSTHPAYLDACRPGFVRSPPSSCSPTDLLSSQQGHHWTFEEQFKQVRAHQIIYFY